MAKTTRTTISMPADLKARMDAVDEPVNWSAVAARAFEAKLAEIITRRGARRMDDVIQRLRASDRRGKDQDYRAGAEAGREWAMQQAEASELRRLAQLRASVHDEAWVGSLEGDGPRPFEASELFVFTINPETDGDRQIARDFWAGKPGFEDAASVGAFVRGFAEGALEVWEAVKLRL